MHRHYIASGLLLVAGLLVAPAAADIVGSLIVVEARNAGGVGEFIVPPNPNWYDPNTGTWTWHLPEPARIRNPHTGEVIGTLEQANLRYMDDPVLSFGFSVSAGQQPTTFTIKTALLQINPPLSPAQGRASAAVTVTDTEGTGALLRGLGGTGGDKIYLAHYNGFVPAGTAFAELLTSIAAGPFGSNAASASVPLTPINVAVANMSSMVGFELTAFDLASGTTVYEITPEPAALVLILLGTLMRRR
ncbi:MAG: hypothetical protein AB1716_10005 [Planctomycetota bacterium]